jgi:hypothetical protein
MPMVITPNVRFLHVPKTGGTWVVGALRASGVAFEVVRRPAMTAVTLVEDHIGLDESRDFADRFTIAFVRHPLTWWTSFWVYRQMTGWEDGHPIDSCTQNDDFNKFIDNVVKYLPGDLSRRFEAYVGPPSQQISFVGRYERLQDDLIDGLRLAGETFDERAIREHAPENTGDYTRYPARYDAAQESELAWAERAAIERFYGGILSPSVLRLAET